MSSDAGGLGPSGTAVAAAILLASLVILGCGLKGDPLPPLRPPEPAEEEVPAGMETAGEASAEGQDEDEENVDAEAEQNAEGENPDAEAEENAEGENAENEVGDSDGEEDGGGAQGPA